MRIGELCLGLFKWLPVSAVPPSLSSIFTARTTRKFNLKPHIVKIPKPKPESDAAAEAERDGEGEREGKEVPLPQTLVRIPVREEKESGPLEDGREDGGSRTGA